MHRRAFTLIEVLAAVTIVAIATAALTVGLGHADANARLRSLAADLVDLDARARLLAQTDGVCELRFPRAEAEREVILARVGRADMFASVAFPTNGRVEARTLDGHRPEAIRVDRGGRSVDYRVTVSLDELTASWTVAGLTGWVEPEEERR